MIKIKNSTDGFINRLDTTIKNKKKKTGQKEIHRMKHLRDKRVENVKKKIAPIADFIFEVKRSKIWAVCRSMKTRERMRQKRYLGTVANYLPTTDLIIYHKPQTDKYKYHHTTVRVLKTKTIAKNLKDGQRGKNRHHLRKTSNKNPKTQKPYRGYSTETLGDKRQRKGVRKVLKEKAAICKKLSYSKNFL